MPQHLGTFQAPTREACIPTAQPALPTKAASAASRWETPPSGAGSALPTAARELEVCAEPPPEGAAPHRGPELRTAAGAAGRRGSQYPGGGRAGRLSRAGSPKEVAAPRAGWGLGRPRLPAAPRAPQPRCLSFGLCGGGGSSTSSAKHCAKQGRAGEAPPDPPQRRTTPTPHSPRRAPGPARPRRPPVRPLAGRARTAGEGDCVSALAGSPPRCSRPVPRQAP